MPETVGRIAATASLSDLAAVGADVVGLLTAVTGLGAALTAVQLLGMPEALLTEAEFCPALRLDDGRALRGVASCCMDTSDGLLATLDQLSRLNRVAFIVDADPVSLLHPKAEPIRAALSVGALPMLAAPHGEFELVFTVAAGNQARYDDICSVRGWSPLVEICRQ